MTFNEQAEKAHNHCSSCGPNNIRKCGACVCHGPNGWNKPKVSDAVTNEAPKMLNGFAVLASRKREGWKKGYIVLVDRGSEYAQRFVSAQCNQGDNEWYLGHYFESLNDAVEDYKDRF